MIPKHRPNVQHPRTQAEPWLELPVHPELGRAVWEETCNIHEIGRLRAEDFNLSQECQENPPYSNHWWRMLRKLDKVRKRLVSLGGAPVPWEPSRDGA